jgi:hypothetical protein
MQVKNNVKGSGLKVQTGVKAGFQDGTLRR